MFDAAHQKTTNRSIGLFPVPVQAWRNSIHYDASESCLSLALKARHTSLSTKLCCFFRSLIANFFTADGICSDVEGRPRLSVQTRISLRVVGQRCCNGRDGRLLILENNNNNNNNTQHHTTKHNNTQQRDSSPGTRDHYSGPASKLHADGRLRAASDNVRSKRLSAVHGQQ